MLVSEVFNYLKYPYLTPDPDGHCPYLILYILAKHHIISAVPRDFCLILKWLGDEDSNIG